MDSVSVGAGLSPSVGGFDGERPEEPRALVERRATPAEMERLISHPAFGAAAERTVRTWGPQPGEDLALALNLSDLGLFIGGLWALRLDAETEGLTRSRLAEVMADWGVTSLGRVTSTLLFMRARRMIEPAPSADGRVKRFTPTPWLRAVFAHFFQRQLEACRPVCPASGPVLARWDEPGVFARFVQAYSQFILGVLQIGPLPYPNLDVFSHRRAGLPVLGQILLAAREEGRAFPSAGPVRLAPHSLARASGTSRGQVQSLLREGARAGWLLPRPDGLTQLSPELLRQVAGFLAMFWLTLESAADDALKPAAPPITAI